MGPFVLDREARLWGDGEVWGMEHSLASGTARWDLKVLPREQTETKWSCQTQLTDREAVLFEWPQAGKGFPSGMGGLVSWSCIHLQKVFLAAFWEPRSLHGLALQM